MLSFFWIFNIMQEEILKLYLYLSLDFISALSSRMSDVAEEPKLDVETAVFYDTLLVLAEAVKMLNFHAFLGPTQVSCLAERSWESGATFFNYINSVETNGITGKIRFEVR